MVPDKMLSIPLKFALRQASSTNSTGTSSPNTSSTSSSASSSSSQASSATTSVISSASKNTTITAPTSTATCTSGSNSANLSPGAAAGIAIATAVVGALLAAFLTYIYMGGKNRRSRSSRTSGEAGFFNFRQPRQNGPKRLGSSSKSEHGMSVRTREHGQSVSTKQPVAVDLDKILPQPADDGTVTQEVSAFFTIIDGHVENFYHDKPVNEIAQLSERTSGQSSLPRGLSVQREVDIDQLLSNPKLRIHAIACLICAEILDSIDPFGDPERSLLPPVVTSFLRSAPPPDMDSHAYQLSLSRWRTSAAYLLRIPRKSGEDRAQRDHVVELLMHDLEVRLSPFIIHEKAEARKADFMSLCKRGERLGLTIFSQPAVWRFQWKLEQKSRAGESDNKDRPLKTPLVVFPALQRTTDNQARKLEYPHVSLEPQLTR